MDEDTNVPDEAVPNMNKLAADVEEFVDLNLQTVEANKSLKIIRARKKELSEKISDFMQSHGIEVINSKSGGQIKLTQRTKLGKVDRNYLEESLSSKLGKDQAQEVVSWAFENRASEPTSSIRVLTKKTSKE